MSAPEDRFALVRFGRTGTQVALVERVENGVATIRKWQSRSWRFTKPVEVPESKLGGPPEEGDVRLAEAKLKLFELRQVGAYAEGVNIVDPEDDDTAEDPEEP